MLDFSEKGICRKVANTFVYAARQKFHPVEFTAEWLQSDTFQLLLDMNLCEICQSYVYQFNSFMMEIKKKGIVVNELEGDYEDLMHWAGYFFSYWGYYDKITGKEIAENYDIKRVLSCYDTLHTVSCEVAIAYVKQDFSVKKRTAARQGK